MENNTKQLLRGHILDYLAKKIPNFKMVGQGGKRIFTCPLAHEHHNMDESPSANFMDEYKVYCYAHRKCFGDVFELVKHVEPDKKKLNEDEIGKYLSELLGLKVDWSAQTNIKVSIQDDLNKLIKNLIEKSNKYIGNLRPDHPVKEYLKTRQFTDDIIEEYNIGYLELQADDIEQYRYLLRKMKLIDDNDNKMFGNNIIFPIYEYGRIKGFQLRNLQYDKTKKGSKYIAYTVEGYDFFCKDVNVEEPIYIVEGITDHIALYKQGIKNAVAIMTSSSNKWYNLRPKKIVFIPDTDWAGLEGLSKNITNLIRYQEVEIKVLEIPDKYKDIDEYTVAGKKLSELKEQDVVHWAVDDFDNRKILAFQYIANRVTEIEKEKYIQYLKEKLEVSKEVIVKDLSAHDRNALSLGKDLIDDKKKMEDKIDEWYNKTKTRTEDVIGLKSLPEFDRWFSGLQGGIYTLLAKPSHCKTLVCINTVVEAIKKNPNILVTYYSIDDSVDHTLAKMVASQCNGKVTIPEVLNHNYIDHNDSLTITEKETKKKSYCQTCKMA